MQATITKPQVRRRSFRLLELIQRAILYAVLSVGAIIFLFPFYQMAVGSFLSEREILSTTPTLWPTVIYLPNYITLFEQLPFARNIMNSAVVSTLRTFTGLFFCSLAGFGFAKFQFPGRRALFIFLLVTMMMPHQITLVPMFIIMRTLGWINTYYPLFVPVMASAFGIFFMRQYIGGAVPDELIDAARIDGCSSFGIYWRIVLPVIRPGLVVLGLIFFMSSWNDFLWPLIVLTDRNLYTIPVALSTLVLTSTYYVEYGARFAGSTLGTIPLIVLFLIFQRQFVSGIMSGAIKG